MTIYQKLCLEEIKIKERLNAQVRRLSKEEIAQLNYSPLETREDKQVPENVKKNAARTQAVARGQAQRKRDKNWGANGGNFK